MGRTSHRGQWGIGRLAGAGFGIFLVLWPQLTETICFYAPTTRPAHANTAPVCLCYKH